MPSFRRFLIAGLLLWVPLGVTVFVVKVMVDFMDRTLLLLPPQYRPEHLLGFTIPGLGILLTVIVVLVTGAVAANLLGRKLVAAWEALLGRIPLVRSVYKSAKQVAETVFSANGKSFRKVLLVEYPRRGIWTLAFQTGDCSGEVQARTGKEVITVFVPTTPNPTSGFIIMVPRDEVVELEMSVESALRMIISLGVIEPEYRPRRPLQPAPGEGAEEPGIS